MCSSSFQHTCTVSYLLLWTANVPSWLKEAGLGKLTGRDSLLCQHYFVLCIQIGNKCMLWHDPNCIYRVRTPTPPNPLAASKQNEDGVNTVRIQNLLWCEAHSPNQERPNEGQLSITNQISGELDWITLSAYICKKWSKPRCLGITPKSANIMQKVHSVAFANLRVFLEC